MTSPSLLHAFIGLVLCYALLRRRELAALLRRLVRRRRSAPPTPPRDGAADAAQLEVVLHHPALFVGYAPGRPLFLRLREQRNVCEAASLLELAQSIRERVQAGELPVPPVLSVFEPGATPEADLCALEQAMRASEAPCALKFCPGHGYELLTGEWVLAAPSLRLMAAALSKVAAIEERPGPAAAQPAAAAPARWVH